MPTVSENVDLPAGVEPQRVLVEVQLYQADNTPLDEAYNSSSQKTIAGRHVVQLDSSGAWSLTLDGNAALTPSGTVWGRRLIGPQIEQSLSYATVSTTPGTYQWQAILTDPPASLAPAALEVGLAAKVAKAGDTMTGSLVLSGTSDLTVEGGDVTIGSGGSAVTIRSDAGRYVLDNLIKNTSPFPGGLQQPDVNRIDFGGIENEGFFMPAGAMASPTASMVFTGGCPGWSMPATGQTDVYVTMEIPEYWLGHRLGISFEWINDHSGTGNVRFEFQCKEVDIFIDTLAGAGSPINYQSTQDAGNAGTTRTTAIANAAIQQGTMPFTPGIFANFYPLRISRLGDDAADTLGGPVRIVAASWFRSVS